MSGVDDVERDVGQLQWVGFEGTTLPDDLRSRIRAGLIGGVLLFSRNLLQRDGATDLAALVALVRAIREAAGDQPPPLLSIDHEGGRVQRLRAPATRWPPMLGLDRLGDDREAVALAHAIGHAMGTELAAVGIELSYAPVLDVHTNPANPIIGDRAFGTEPERVADRALALASGLQRAGVIPCGKHFPGHGDTATDSHLALPRVDADEDRLWAVELEPFRRAAEASLPAIMTAHVVFPAVEDGVPATLSARAIDGLLRQQLGFRGVIVSDDLDMKAISDRYGAGDAAVGAIDAGCDALLLCRDPAAQRDAFEALVDKARADDLFGARVAAAAAAIRELRARFEPGPMPTLERAREALGTAEHRALADRLAEAGQGGTA